MELICAFILFFCFGLWGERHEIVLSVQVFVCTNQLWWILAEEPRVPSPACGVLEHYTYNLLTSLFACIIGLCFRSESSQDDKRTETPGLYYIEHYLGVLLFVVGLEFLDSTSELVVFAYSIMIFCAFYIPFLSSTTKSFLASSYGKGALVSFYGFCLWILSRSSIEHAQSASRAVLVLSCCLLVIYRVVCFLRIEGRKSIEFKWLGGGPQLLPSLLRSNTLELPGSFAGCTQEADKLNSLGLYVHPPAQSLTWKPVTYTYSYPQARAIPSSLQIIDPSLRSDSLGNAGNLLPATSPTLGFGCPNYWSSYKANPNFYC